ncbi:MAG: RnfH family protein [Buchnera aphidicola (Nurudea yanoniella)]
MKLINILIIYALKNKQYIEKMTLKHKISIKKAILTSNIIKDLKINIENNNVGIYGKIVDLQDFVNDGDRIEIYRTLLIDPKERRRKNILLKNK